MPPKYHKLQESRKYIFINAENILYSMDNEQKRSLKQQAQQMRPSIIIGKQGLSENAIIQIKKYLQANKLCKVKLSRNFLDSQEKDRKVLAEQLATSTESEIINQVGFVVVLWKN